MNQLAIDFDGRRGRDAGMQQALEHAARLDAEWKDRAYAWLLLYAKTHAPFSTMQCRKAAYQAGAVNRPPTEFAWGGIVHRAVASGVLVRAGDENIGDTTSHAKLTPLWRAA